MTGLFSGLLGTLKGLGGSLLGGFANGLGSIFGNSDILGGLLSVFGQNRQFRNQMKLQDDAQSFNAWQADINRDFNALQAEIARDWQERFYNQYQSPKAMMAQYMDAGINPMLVAGQGAGSPPSASSASGSVASSGIGSSASSSLVADVVQMMMIKAQLKEIESRENLNNSQAYLFRSQTEKTNIDVQFSPEIYRMNLETGKVNIQNMLAGIRQIDNNIEISKQQIDLAVKEFNQSKKESDSRISINEVDKGLKVMQSVLVSAQTEESKSRHSLNFSTIGVNSANVAYINEKTLREYWETRYREEYNTSPSSSIYTFIKELIMRSNGSMRRVGNDDRFLNRK